MGSGSTALSTREVLDEIRHLEDRFNTTQAGIRRLASVWLLAALAAIALLVREPTSEALLPPRVVIGAVAAMGSVGLFVLWNLDQRVYQQLLGAVFYIGIRMEYLNKSVPPTRSMMMVASAKRGMARRLQHYYLVPITALGMMSAGAIVWHLLAQHSPLEISAGEALLILIFFAVIMAPPLAVLRHHRSAKRDQDLLAAFGDPDFARVGFAEIVARNLGGSE